MIRLSSDDNPIKLMSIAMKPLCEPPFPLERIEEMTALMGGDGIHQPELVFSCYRFEMQLSQKIAAFFIWINFDFLKKHFQIF